MTSKRGLAGILGAIAAVSLFLIVNPWFAVDPKGGANSWFTGYNDPKVTTLVHEAQHQTNHVARCKLYAKMQDISAQDAFSGFLYYSPFPYAYSDKVHGFFVSPLGNFHLEDVWLG